SQQGFHVIEATGQPIPIGKEQVDRYFFGDYDQSNLQLIIGAPDPNGTRLFWAYKAQSGASGQFTKLLCYDYGLNPPRWSIINQNGHFIATLATPGLTLEALDAISSSIDALTFSLDDVAVSGLPKFAMWDSTGSLGFSTGSNLEATLDTAEQELDD